MNFVKHHITSVLATLLLVILYFSNSVFCQPAHVVNPIDKPGGSSFVGPQLHARVKSFVAGFLNQLKAVSRLQKAPIQYCRCMNNVLQFKMQLIQEANGVQWFENLVKKNSEFTVPYFLQFWSNFKCNSPTIHFANTKNPSEKHIEMTLSDSDRHNNARRQHASKMTHASRISHSPKRPHSSKTTHAHRQKSGRNSGNTSGRRRNSNRHYSNQRSGGGSIFKGIQRALTSLSKLLNPNKKPSMNPSFERNSTNGHYILNRNIHAKSIQNVRASDAYLASNYYYLKCARELAYLSTIREDSFSKQVAAEKKTAIFGSYYNLRQYKGINLNTKKQVNETCTTNGKCDEASYRKTFASAPTNVTLVLHWLQWDHSLQDEGVKRAISKLEQLFAPIIPLKIKPSKVQIHAKLLTQYNMDCGNVSCISVANATKHALNKDNWYKPYHLFMHVAPLAHPDIGI